MTKRAVIWVLIFTFIVIGAIVALIVVTMSANLNITSSEASLVNKIYFRRENPYKATVNKDSKFKLYIDAGLTDGAAFSEVADLKIKYNPDILEAILLSGNESYKSTNKKIDNVTGLITLTVNSDSGFSIDKNIGYIEFRVKTSTLNDVLINLEKGSTLGNPNTLDIASSKIYILTNSEFSCPSFDPPVTGWCNGKEEFGGYSDRGCPLPPKCNDNQ